MNIKQTDTKTKIIITNTVFQKELPLDAVGYIDGYVRSSSKYGNCVCAIVIIDKKVAEIPLSCIRIVEE